MLLQLDDPLDAIAVHAWNGTWGVIAVGFFAGQGLITQSYGVDPYTGLERQYGCFLGGNGRLLGAQIIYACWLGGQSPLQNSLLPVVNPSGCCYKVHCWLTQMLGRTLCPDCAILMRSVLLSANLT